MSMASSSLSSSAYHRLYEFAKMALVKIFAFPYATVCELYSSGGGADTNKWDDAQIGHYIGIGIGIGSSYMSEARENWESLRKPYPAEFCDLDPCTEDLDDHLRDKGIPAADLVCCLHNLQLCFQSEEKASRLLQNVSSLLKPGGYFFGLTPDSSTIWTKYQKNVEAAHSSNPKGGGSMKPSVVPTCIRSDNYIITLELDEDKFPPFGKRYQLKFSNDMAFESHCLVHFPSLIRLAREAGLDYIEIQNLAEFYDDNRSHFAAMLSCYGTNFVDPRGKLLARSFDILGLYSMFVFQKPDPDAIPPAITPLLLDGGGDHFDDEEVEEQQQQQHDYYWMGRSSWEQQQPSALASTSASASASADDEIRANVMDTTITATSTTTTSTDGVTGEQDKGILGPGPTDLRFSDPL